MKKYLEGIYAFNQDKKAAKEEKAVLLPALIFIAVSVFLAYTPLSAQNAVTAGTLSSPYPTITNLAVDWLITGDVNYNSVVTVKYRIVREEDWHEGMPLRRIPAGQSTGTDPIFTWPEKHSGSIFNLKPDTEYEISLTLADPDGGSAERTLSARTRPVPKPAPNAVIRKVDSGTFNTLAAAAQPGDILLLAPGNYGSVSFQRDGGSGNPIVIRGDRSDTTSQVVFTGFSLYYRKHIILEQVTVNGKVNLLGAEDVAVCRCIVNAKFGIVASDFPGAKNCYVADNVVSSTMPWAENALGAGSVIEQQGREDEGIQMTGPGNVICYNRVYGYRDCISYMEDRSVADQYCIDIYNNDIYVGVDDAIEADFCQGNCRIMRNRITNCFMGLSSQPSLGGPTYFIRNVMYNIIDCPFKLARYSKGDVVLHNTTVKVGDGFRVIHNPSLAYFRNNLAIGGVCDPAYGIYSATNSPNGEGRAIEFPNADSTCDLDYDAVGTYGTPFLAKIDGIKVYTFADLITQTPEKHAVLVDMNVFNAPVVFPYPAMLERQPADLRLKPGSAAVDAGLFIPNVNSAFNGSAPDIGAYELGEELPHYGPRPESWSSGTLVSGKSCDYSGDSRLAVTDVITLLVMARRDPSDPVLDWNNDGAYSIADAISLLRDIVSGSCPDTFSTDLASAGQIGNVAKMEGLTEEEILFVERMMVRMNLSKEEEAAFHLALYGTSGPVRLPRVFSLSQNSPNPFNPSTTIAFTVPEGNKERVTLEIFDLRGGLVKKLVDEVREGGFYTVFWDGTSDSGLAAASGVYFYRLRAGNYSQVRKMVLLK